MRVQCGMCINLNPHANQIPPRPPLVMNQPTTRAARPARGSTYRGIRGSVGTRPRAQQPRNLRSRRPRLGLALLGADDGRIVVEVGAAINLRPPPEPIAGAHGPRDGHVPLTGPLGIHSRLLRASIATGSHGKTTLTSAPSLAAPPGHAATKGHRNRSLDRDLDRRTRRPPAIQVAGRRGRWRRRRGWGNEEKGRNWRKTKP